MWKFHWTGKRGKQKKKIYLTSTPGSDQEEMHRLLRVPRTLFTYRNGERKTFFYSIEHIRRGDALITQENQEIRQRLYKRKCVNAKLQRWTKWTAWAVVKKMENALPSGPHGNCVTVLKLAAKKRIHTLWKQNSILEESFCTLWL